MFNSPNQHAIYRGPERRNTQDRRMSSQRREGIHFEPGKDDRRNCMDRRRKSNDRRRIGGWNDISSRR